MKNAVVLLMLAVATSSFAAGKPRPVLLDCAQPSALGPDRSHACDPRIEQIHEQERTLLARGDRDGARRLELQIQELRLQARAEQPDKGRPVLVTEPPTQSGSFAPDRLITGTGVMSFATDYEQDATGTMWVCSASQADSIIYVYKSTDHGATWQWLLSFNRPPKHEIGKLEMVVGEGDSDFVYVWELTPENNGDLYVVRFNQDGTNFTGGEVLVGPDTITDFAACRDFSGSNYWLYACAYNGLQAGNSPVAQFLRSVDYGLNWAIMDTVYNCARPRLTFGAGSYMYQSAVPQPVIYRGRLQANINTLWCSPDAWLYTDITADTFVVYDGVVAPAFTLPESSATIWAVYDHNYQNSGDWDVLYAWSDDRFSTTNGPDYLAGSGSATEAYPDLKHYTSNGNSYINASYVITGTNESYIAWAEAGSPANWQGFSLVNQVEPVGWSYPNIPRIVYSPHGPGSGGGLVFANNSYAGLYFNAPWFTGGAVAENQVRLPAVGLTVSPSIASGSVRVSWTGSAECVIVTDVAGRVVSRCNRPVGNSLVWDGRVPSGTYLVRLQTGSGQATAAVVVQ